MVHVEIVDPESGAPVPDGNPGKILVTNLDRTLVPLIRYEVGDLGRILPERCPCGRTVRLMELLGRSDDLLRVGTNLIALSSVAESISRVPGLSLHFRMVARREGIRDLLRVEVEARDAAAATRTAELERSLIAAMEQVMHEEMQEFRTSPSAGVVVCVVSPGSLPRNPRTGKIKQSVDER